MKSAPVLEDILEKYGPLAELHLAEYIPALNRLTSAETGSCFGDYLDDLYLVSKTNRRRDPLERAARGRGRAFPRRSCNSSRSCSSSCSRFCPWSACCRRLSRIASGCNSFWFWSTGWNSLGWNSHTDGGQNGALAVDAHPGGGLVPRRAAVAAASISCGAEEVSRFSF